MIEPNKHSYFFILFFEVVYILDKNRFIDLLYQKIQKFNLKFCSEGKVYNKINKSYFSYCLTTNFIGCDGCMFIFATDFCFQSVIILKICYWRLAWSYQISDSWLI